MNNYKSTLQVLLIMLPLALLLGGSLSFILGLSFESFKWIDPGVTIINSLALGSAAIISIYFAKYLVEKDIPVYQILTLSFGIMLGAGIIAIFGFFIYNPATFLYSESRTVTFLLTSLLVFQAINIISSGFVVFQFTVSKKEKALSEEILLKSQMELKFLTAKINPHFLFNSLNLLISQLRSPEKAEETLLNLSDLLRYQLDVGDKNTVALETELDIVKKYLSIQKQRFGEKLTYSINSLESASIPPLIIQPLVENSIKHNIDRVDCLDISVEIISENNTLNILILDSLKELQPEMINRGIGLTVTKKRVELFGGEFSITNGGILMRFSHD